MDLALNTDGYWLFIQGGFWTDSPETERWRLNGSREAYWEAFRRANAELRRFSQTPLTRYRTIPPVRQSSFYDTAQQQLLTTPELRDGLEKALEFSVIHSDLPNQPNSSSIYRKSTLFHCVPEGTGSFTITHVSLGKDPDPELFRHTPDPQSPVSYRVFEQGGNMVLSGSVSPPESPKTVTLPEEYAGMVSILTASDTHGAQISFAGLACVAEIQHIPAINMEFPGNV
jgi:hypothetical protein